MRSNKSKHSEKEKKTPRLHYICSLCDDEYTLVKHSTSFWNLKAKLSNAYDKLTQLTSDVDKHKNILHMQSAQVNNSGVDTTYNESITAFIREERLRYDRKEILCIFNLQQVSEDLRKFW